MKILICPLNWGLGHASRDIVIIRKLLERGHMVTIAAHGPALEMLTSEFPNLDQIPFRSLFNITYFRSLPAWLKILIISPFIGLEILWEHFRLKKIVREIQADLIISDNRYGLWHNHIPSVLITHQLNPRLPRFLGFMERPVAGVIHLIAKQFHRCWVPDYPGDDNLTGNLVHKYKLPENIIFTGPLSRFMPDQKVEGNSAGTATDDNDIPLAHFEIVILISGPESQRTKLENIILEQIGDFPLRSIILQGLPGEIVRRDAGPLSTIFSHLPSDKIKILLENARYIICRGGYTSIMDLITLGRTAMIIPTPGQTEQEYLATYLSRKGIFLSMEQKNFDLGEAVQKLDGFQSIIDSPENMLLYEELDKWF